MSEKLLPSSPVFYDPRGRRWRHVKRTYLALGVIITALAAIFIASVLANPFLGPRLNLRQLSSLPRKSDIAPRPIAVPKTHAELEAKNAQVKLQKEESKTRVVPAQRPQLMPIAPPPTNTPLLAPATFTSKPLSIGFYVDWDESSYASLERNLDHLDWVVAQWAHLVDAKNGSSPLSIELDAKALNLIRERRPQTSIIPMVQNLSDEKWENDVLARAVADEDSRQKLVAALSQFVEQNKFAGVAVDFEEPTKDTQPNLLRFMQE